MQDDALLLVHLKRCEKMMQTEKRCEKMFNLVPTTCFVNTSCFIMTMQRMKSVLDQKELIFFRIRQKHSDFNSR